MQAQANSVSKAMAFLILLRIKLGLECAKLVHLPRVGQLTWSQCYAGMSDWELTGRDRDEGWMRPNYS